MCSLPSRIAICTLPSDVVNVHASWMTRFQHCDTVGGASLRWAIHPSYTTPVITVPLLRPVGTRPNLWSLIYPFTGWPSYLRVDDSWWPFPAVFALCLTLCIPRSPSMLDVICPLSFRSPWHHLPCIISAFQLCQYKLPSTHTCHVLKVL